MWGKIVGAIGGVAEEYIKSDARVQEANINVELKRLEAKANAYMVTQSRTFDLDMAAVKEAAKSWWDEFLVCTYLSPLFASILAALGLPIDPEPVWQVFESLGIGKENYKWGMLLIGVRYLGFRNLLREFLKARALMPGKATSAPGGGQ